MHIQAYPHGRDPSKWNELRSNQIFFNDFFFLCRNICKVVHFYASLRLKLWSYCKIRKHLNSKKSLHNWDNHFTARFAINPVQPFHADHTLNRMVKLWELSRRVCSIACPVHPNIMFSFMIATSNLFHITRQQYSSWNLTNKWGQHGCNMSSLSHLACMHAS